MNTLFLVQFACCIIVSMLGLILVLSRFQIRWTNRRYEVSRWLLAFLCLYLQVILSCKWFMVSVLKAMRLELLSMFSSILQSLS